MKAKVFEKLIRKIIREEIDYALSREIRNLKEDLRNSTSIIEENKNLSLEQKSSLKEKIMGQTPVKKHINQQYTSNSTLNNLLNETAMGDTNLNSNMSPVSMEGEFNTIGDVPVEAAPQEVVNAVTRDYSDLMKAIDKKKNNRP